MSAFRRIERIFSYIGTFCQVLGACLILLVLGDLALGAMEQAKILIETGSLQKVDQRYKSPVYDGDPDRIAYWTEFNRAWDVHFEPYYHWRRNSFVGTYINVDEHGVRRTPGAAAQADGAERKTVFMLGGSTMWGTGVADDKTIPAILQGLLGPDYEVRNYGESAYVSAQQLNYLLYRLALGEVPDVVVFYDGVNDGYAGAYSPAVPRDPHNLRAESERGPLRELLDGSNYKQLADFLSAKLNQWTAPEGKVDQTAWAERIGPKVAENAKGVIEMYEATIRQVRALATEYGFKAYFFWQPNLFSLTRTHLTPYEQEVLDSADPVLVASQLEAYRQARVRLSGREAEGIYFLGNIFDGVSEPIYIDWHHIGTNGNEIVAQEIFNLIRDKL